MRLRYRHVDVFAATPYSGNSLTVFPDVPNLSAGQMLTIAQEMRHFESIFVAPCGPDGAYPARVFSLPGELHFAGHPVIGAACVLHDELCTTERASWQLTFATASVTVMTRRTALGYDGLLDQGQPRFLGTLERSRVPEIAAALDLEPSCVSETYPAEIVSTGLRYLIFPVERGLGQARIVHRAFDAVLAAVGADFIYVLDVDALEGRTWNNDGIIEDVATGSAAGTVGAYAVKHGRIAGGKEFVLHQGRFAGRPSEMTVVANGTPDDVTGVSVWGSVALVGSGELLGPPREE